MKFNFSILLFGLIILNLFITGIGNFLYDGAGNYGNTNITNYALYNQTSNLEDSISYSQTNLSGGTIQIGDSIGDYFSGVLGIVFDFFKGQWIEYFINIIDLLFDTGYIVIPVYIKTSINLMIILLFIISAIRFFSGRGGDTGA